MRYAYYISHKLSVSLSSSPVRQRHKPPISTIRYSRLMSPLCRPILSPTWERPGYASSAQPSVQLPASPVIGFRLTANTAKDRRTRIGVWYVGDSPETFGIRLQHSLGRTDRHSSQKPHSLSLTHRSPTDLALDERRASQRSSPQRLRST